MDEFEMLRRKQVGDWIWMGMGGGIVLALCLHPFITGKPMMIQFKALLGLAAFLTVAISIYHLWELLAFNQRVVRKETDAHQVRRV